MTEGSADDTLAQPVSHALLMRNDWRGVRVAEGAALEMPYTLMRIGGSNPPLSAFDSLFVTGDGFERLPAVTSDPLHIVRRGPLSAGECGIGWGV